MADAPTLDSIPHLLPRIAQWPCNPLSVHSSWAIQLPPTPWISSVSESDHSLISLHLLSITPILCSRLRLSLQVFQFLASYIHEGAETVVHSRKMTHNLDTVVKPLIEKGGKYDGKVKVIIRQQVQPWHSSSTLVHEIALAVSFNRSLP